MGLQEPTATGEPGSKATELSPEERGLDLGFRLAEASVDPRATTIRIGDDRRRIDYKAMQVLLCLASRAGEEVSKGEILARVWPGQAVCDEVLTVAVSTLRRALGDNARSPRFIQTIPRVGYRLIAPLTVPKPKPASRPPRADPSATSHRRRPWRLAASLSLTAALGWLLAGLTIPMRSSPASTPEGVAVLPFVNDTGDPDQEFLADGLTQALITGLARESQLRVTPRRSVMPLKRSASSLEEIAGELEVDAIVEGSVQRFEDRLRLSAALVDAERNRVLWTSSLDTHPEDLPAAQQQLTREIAQRLSPRDPLASEVRFGSQSFDREAFRAYLRGRALAGDCAYDRRRAHQAVAELRRSIALEPDFAAAHSALARAHLGLALREREIGRPEHRQWVAEAQQAVERALALDPNRAEAHAVHGVLLASFEWRFTAAESAFHRSLSLDPQDFRTHDAYSKLLASLGRFEEALAHRRRVEELKPEKYFDSTAARILFRARHYREAIVELDARADAASGDPEPYFLRASILERLERPQEAIAAFTQGLHLQGTDRQALAAIEDAFDVGGFEGVYRWILPRYQDEISGRGPVTRSRLAIYAGDPRPALDDLEQALQVRDPDLLRIATDPTFDPVRNEPRFRQLLARMGLTAPRRPLESVSRLSSSGRGRFSFSGWL